MTDPSRSGSASASASRSPARPLVGYLVGLNAATSIPVEMARDLAQRDIDLDLLVYYRQTDRHVGVPANRILALEGRGPWDLRPVIRLVRYLFRRRPDVLHVHHSWTAFVAVVLGTLLNIPVTVKTEHRAHRSGPSPRQLLNALTLVLVDAVVTNSHATAASLPPWLKGRIGPRLRTIHNGVDFERIEQASPSESRRDGIRANLPGRELKLVTVGRLIGDKNQAALLTALAELRPPACESGLTLVGGGPRRSGLEREARRLGVSSRVCFTGWKSRQDVYEILHSADLFVLSSRTEGFCNAAVEAMAAGCPVLCSDLPVLREVVGNEGIFADPTLPGSFARAIERFAGRSPDERRAMGRALERRARERFSLERVSAEYQRLYFELLGAETRDS